MAEPQPRSGAGSIAGDPFQPHPGEASGTGGFGGGGGGGGGLSGSPATASVKHLQASVAELRLGLRVEHRGNIRKLVRTLQQRLERASHDMQVPCHPPLATWCCALVASQLQAGHCTSTMLCISLAVSCSTYLCPQHICITSIRMLWRPCGRTRRQSASYLSASHSWRRQRRQQHRQGPWATAGRQLLRLHQQPVVGCTPKVSTHRRRGRQSVLRFHQQAPRSSAQHWRQSASAPPTCKRWVLLPFRWHGSVLPQAYNGGSAAQVSTVTAGLAASLAMSPLLPQSEGRSTRANYNLFSCRHYRRRLAAPWNCRKGWQR